MTTHDDAHRWKYTWWIFGTRNYPALVYITYGVNPPPTVDFWYQCGIEASTKEAYAMRDALQHLQFSLYHLLFPHGRLQEK